MRCIAIGITYETYFFVASLGEPRSVKHLINPRMPLSVCEWLSLLTWLDAPAKYREEKKESRELLVMVTTEIII